MRAAIRTCAHMLVAAFATASAAAGTAALASGAEQAPGWAIAPEVYGFDLPLQGASLFDQRVAALGGPAAIPFPFENLLRRLEGTARCPDLPDGRCLVRVLIPIGRSLQRLAAAPEFFRRPRVVAAMVGEPGAGAGEEGPLQRDRLYLGYVEGSDVIEVISYNEAAARFEFQLVHDYRPGSTPRLTYASRAVCLSCHQNHAPIFSRPLWQETNANPAVAARLLAFGESVQGVPVRRGIDLPAAIDAAVARANRFALWQTLWRDGCGDGARGVRCRAALFEAALRYRATGRHEQTERIREAILPVFAVAWRARWPRGLALPDPNIPNRDPLPGDVVAISPALANIPARFEPLAPREPLEIWTEPDTLRLNETIAGLADFLDDGDLARIRAALAHRNLRTANFDAVSDAISTLAAAPDGGPFAAGPFRRDRLMPALLAQLGQRAPTTHQARSDIPPARYPEHQPVPIAGLFQRYCTPCHQTPASTPPNFLDGGNATAQARLTHCAARIRYRLAMWQLPPEARPKTPMPPLQALRGLGADPATWAASSELATLQTYAAELAGGGPVPKPDNYETLPPCLPG
ncbi:hypothetical protein [Azoarcus sp. KH32C]|uniref:hypothetical protein n=1 Tax=Azoarcus sp. KH32C TaxID=748247 RepID=UPI0002386BD4|nr:hypothetical protein [Azoarcus sp. KH32C]BAL26533.1 hypothetical protein AZKH_4254 [Azoarcus sp. KH32C]